MGEETNLVVTADVDARLRAWERLARIRRRRWLALLALLLAALSFSFVGAVFGSAGKGVFDTLMFIGFLVAMAFVIAPALTRCPDCGKFFEWTLVQRNPFTSVCLHCGASVPNYAFQPRRVVAASAPAPEPPAPEETPLTRYAAARDFRVVQPNGIVGYVRGVRVGIERVEGMATHVDSDAGTIDVAALDTAIAARVPGSRTTQHGPIVRIELPSADLDPEALDDTLDLVARAAVARGAVAYR